MLIKSNNSNIKATYTLKKTAALGKVLTLPLHGRWGLLPREL